MNKTLISLIFTSTLLSGCFLSQKLDVPQGNQLEQNQITQLKQGMTKAQVRYILGDPVLQDTFNQNRWTYVYQRHVGSKLVKENRILVYFVNGKMSKTNKKT